MPIVTAVIAEGCLCGSTFVGLAGDAVRLAGHATEVEYDIFMTLRDANLVAHPLHDAWILDLEDVSCE